MYYLVELKRYLTQSWGILSKGFFNLWFWYTKTLFNALLKTKGHKKNIHISISGYNILVPNNFVAVLMLSEIFVYKVYDRLKGLDHILDLGGYVGDSAIFLAKHNSKVTMVESDPHHYNLAIKNTEKLQNIEVLNGAIVASDIQKIYLVGDNEYRGTVQSEIAKFDPSKVTEINAIQIQKLESEHIFDGLKMDIEGGEYEIIRYWITQDKFTYKKGFIEFHFSENNKNKNIEEFRLFIHFISSKKYFYHLYDNSSNKISMIDFMDQVNLGTNEEFINLYFEKDIV